jgi:effector-binding domain-containing protein
MHRPKAHTSTVVALVGALAGIAEAAPVADRPMQQGTKVVAAMYVAYASKTSAPEDVDAQTSETLNELWTLCVDNGLHPAGPPTVVAEIQPQADQPVRWEAWLPLADQPSEDDLANRGPVPIKQVPEARVAFTYHSGDPGNIQGTFAALVKWMVGEGMTPAGHARVVVSMTPPDGQPEHMTRECQFEMQGGAPGAK